MSRYNQYGQYYDPVGSQSNQPTSYTYQTPTSTTGYQNAPSATAYGSSNYQNYGNSSYGSEQYGSNGQQQTSSSTNHAAAALSSLSGQSYIQSSTANAPSSNPRYDDSHWSGAGNNTNAYSSNPSSVSNRAQSNNSPLHNTTQSSSTFGRTGSTDQSQSDATAFGAQSTTYTNAPSNAGVRSSPYYSQQQKQSQRYNSPLHAVQAQQHGHRQQVSQSSNNMRSPQLGNAAQAGQQNRQSSASVEPSPITVDPSQVYDNRAELHRQAQIDAEKRKRYEAEQAAREAEEERVAEEKRKQKAAQKAQEDAAKKAREEKKQSKNAATALQRMASGTSDEGPAGQTDEEAEMRAMFQKMREFNAKNPAMLAKLWDEERKSHEAGKSASPPATSSTPASAKKVSTASTSSTATPSSEARPFLKPGMPPRGAKGPSASKKTPQTPAAPVAKPTPTPTSTPGNTQLWPPHKKGALAEVTAKWLLSLPQNAGKTIQPTKVLAILDSNPAYVQLCESLEGLGLQFDRSSLARELLKAVPDVYKPQTQTKGSTPVNGVSTAAAQVSGATAGFPVSAKGKQKATDPTRMSTSAITTNYEAPISLSDAAREVKMMGRQGFPAINDYGSPTQKEPSRFFPHRISMSNGSRPVSSWQPPEVKPEMKPEEPPRPPADKEEAARKRAFGDLVDLTKEDSDDDDGPPPKRMMLPPSAPMNGVNTQQRDPLAYLAKPMSFDQFMHQGQRKPLRGQGGFQLPGQRMQPPPVPSQPQGGLNSILHPLNNAQQPVIPTQPAPQPRQKGPSPESLQLTRMRGKMLVEPIMRDRVARKSRYDSKTIARDVLLATGRHPDMRGLNAHLAGMQKLLGAHGGVYDAGNGSDLATIKWEIIDPEPPKKEEESKNNDAAAGADGQLKRKLNTTVSVAASPAPSGTLNTGPKKRGRPPKKAKRIIDPASLPRHSPGLASSAGTPDASSAPANASSNSRPTTPSQIITIPPTSEPKMSTKPLGYADFNQYTADGTKKKGRPFGWRKNVHSREAQGHAPATGRPRKSLPPPTTSPAVQPLAAPQYAVFRCEWEGCKSELHNLKTLKKHIVKVHGRASTRTSGEVEGQAARFECKWMGCEGGGFAEIEPWTEHVDEVHLGPVGWALGDGIAVDHYNTCSSQRQLPHYLADGKGRQVTPTIRAPPPPQPPKPQTTDPDPPHHFMPKPRGRLQKDGIPRHLRPGGSSDARRVRGTRSLHPGLASLAQQQRDTGWILGRMGCVLADEGRRRVFLEGEDFEVVVVASDEED